MYWHLLSKVGTPNSVDFSNLILADKQLSVCLKVLPGIEISTETSLTIYIILLGDGAVFGQRFVFTKVLLKYEVH